MVVTRSRSNSVEPSPVIPDTAPRGRSRAGRKKKEDVEVAAPIAEQVIPEEEEPRSEGDKLHEDSSPTVPEGEFIEPAPTPIAAQLNEEPLTPFANEDEMALDNEQSPAATEVGLIPTLPAESSIGESDAEAPGVGFSLYQRVQECLIPPFLAQDVVPLARIFLDNYELCNADFSEHNRVASALRLIQLEVVRDSNVINVPCRQALETQMLTSVTTKTNDLYVDPLKYWVDFVVCAHMAAKLEYESAVHDDNRASSEYSVGSLFDGDEEAKDLNLHPNAPPGRQDLTEENQAQHTAWLGPGPKVGEPDRQCNMLPAMVQKAQKMHKEYRDSAPNARFPAAPVEIYLARGHYRNQRIGRITFPRMPAPQTSASDGALRPPAYAYLPDPENVDNNDPGRSSGAVRRLSPRAPSLSHPYQRRQSGGGVSRVRKSIPKMTINTTAPVNISGQTLQLPQDGTPDTDFWRQHGASAATSKPAISPNSDPNAPLEALQEYCGNDFGVNFGLMHSAGSTENLLLLEGRRMLSDAALTGGALKSAHQQRLALIMVADQLQQRCDAASFANELRSIVFNPNPVVEPPGVNVAPATEGVAAIAPDAQYQHQNGPVSNLLQEQDNNVLAFLGNEDIESQETPNLADLLNLPAPVVTLEQANNLFGLYNQDLPDGFAAPVEEAPTTHTLYNQDLPDGFAAPVEETPTTNTQGLDPDSVAA